MTLCIIFLYHRNFLYFISYKCAYRLSITLNELFTFWLVIIFFNNYIECFNSSTSTITKVTGWRIRNRVGASASFSNFVFLGNTAFLCQIISSTIECTRVIKKLFFLAGLYFFVGFAGSIKFFTKKGKNLTIFLGKIKGSIVYFSGMILIIMNMGFFGAIAQITGFILIFRSFLPDLYEYICKAPFVGKYLSNC